MAQSVSFQFQYGTIKTYLIFSCFLLDVSDFNSMMVQLKLIEKINPSHPDKDFNSIMVQLKPNYIKSRKHFAWIGYIM